MVAAVTRRRLAFVLGLVAGLLLGAILAPRAASVQPHAILPLNEWQPIPSPAASADPSPTPTTAYVSLPSPVIGVAPRPTAVAKAVASKPASPPAHRIAGQGSWYCSSTSPCTKGYPSGLYAAAGPALRAFLGSGWRGSTVTICGKQSCIRATLIDSCTCARLVDLYSMAFQQLAPLSRGVVSITVSRP